MCELCRVCSGVSEDRGTLGIHGDYKEIMRVPGEIL